MKHSSTSSLWSMIVLYTFGDQKKIKAFLKNWDLYLILSIPLAYIIIFHYVPMYGAQIAFRRFNPASGITGSKWVGTHYFVRFITSYHFFTVIKNTLLLSLYQLIAGFPMPIILAIMLNYARFVRFKKAVQMITYFPYFISVVVMCGMILQFLAPRYGIINVIIQALGGEQRNFMGNPASFRPVYVLSGIWQGTGFSSIIYLAVLSNVDVQLHEAAIIDGAMKVRRIWHIDITALMPTATILLILNCGNLLRLGFEKAFLLQNPVNLSTAEVIQTYVYKIGLAADVPNYSYATAIGLFTSVVGFILLIVVNRIARKVGHTSLW